MNGRGRTVARVGEGIRAVAVGVSWLNDLGAVEREEAREIQERCPSEKYWLVGGGVKTTRAGDHVSEALSTLSSENAPSTHAGE